MGFLVRSRRRAAMALTVLTLLFGLLLIPAGAMAIMSPMMFDAPGSTGITGLWLIFAGAVSLPIFLLLAILLAWILFFTRKYRAAILVHLLPLISAALFGVGALLFP